MHLKNSEKHIQELKEYKEYISPEIATLKQNQTKK